MVGSSPAPAGNERERKKRARGGEGSQANTAEAPRRQLAGGDGADELASRLRVAVTRLNRRLRQESLAGVTPPQAMALGSISRLGRPTLGELAYAEQVQPPTMTKLVAQMEASGLVARHPDAADRRVCRVELTSLGRDTQARIRASKDAYLAQRLARLEPAAHSQSAALVALLEGLVDDR